MVRVVFLYADGSLDTVDVDLPAPPPLAEAREGRVGSHYATGPDLEAGASFPGLWRTPVATPPFPQE